MSKVYLFVEIDVKPGQQETFLEKLQSHVSVIRGEDGCEFIEPYLDTQVENKICVLETWRDRTSWDAHMVNDSSKAWQQIAPQFVVGEKITILKSI